MVVLREGMCPGLDAAVLRDLRAADIKTVEELVCCDTEELAQRSSLSYKALLAIRRVLLAQHTAFPVSGADLYEELLSCTAILSTGNPSLDKLLDSGLHTGEVTELAGAPGSGKSQVCFGVAVHAAQHLRQSVMFVDTTGALAAGRLLQMLRAESCDAEQQVRIRGDLSLCRVSVALSRVSSADRGPPEDPHLPRLRHLRFTRLSVRAARRAAAAGVCWRRLGEGSDRGLGFGRPRSSARRKTQPSFVPDGAAGRGPEDHRQGLQCGRFGNKPCEQEQRRRAAAQSGSLLESRPQNQSAAGAGGRRRRALGAALGHADQILPAAVSPHRGGGPALVESLCGRSVGQKETGADRFLTGSSASN